MSTTRRRTTRALSGLAVGTLSLALAACGTSGTDSSATSNSGSKKLEKTG